MGVFNLLGCCQQLQTFVDFLGTQPHIVRHQSPQALCAQRRDTALQKRPAQVAGISEVGRLQVVQTAPLRRHVMLDQKLIVLAILLPDLR